MIKKICLIVLLPLLLCCERIKEVKENPLAPDSQNNKSYGDWTLIHQQNENQVFYALHFTDLDNGWMVGKEGTILHSTDGGKNWGQQNSGTTANLWDVSFADAATGWVCGHNNTLLKTTDGGNSWQNFSPGDAPERLFVSVHFTDANNGWFCTNQGEISRTTDGGMTWQLVLKFPSSGSLMSVLDAQTVFVEHGEKLYSTHDGGASWDSFAIAIDKIYSISDICFADKDHGYFATLNGTGGMMITEYPVIMTTDGGSGWRQSQPLKDGMFACIFFVGSTGWLAGSENVYKTTDAGSNWQLDLSRQDGLFTKDICFINETCGWLMTFKGGIYKYDVSE